MSIVRVLGSVVAIVVVLGVVGTMGAYWMFLHEIRADTERLTTAARSAGTLVTDTMLASLPTPAQRYFRYAGIIGRPIPTVVRLTQTGHIRGSAEAAWMAFEANETYSTNPPAFVWQAFMPGRTSPVALGRDEYLEGSGSILMKLLALVPVADEHGDELSEAGLMRYLNECMWFPAALLGPNMTISAVDPSSFEVTLTDHGRSASGVFIVDADGRLTTFRAKRYNTGTRSIETWETPIAGYQQWAGLNLPSRGTAVWKLPSGDYAYIELEIGGVSYE